MMTDGPATPDTSGPAPEPGHDGAGMGVSGGDSAGVDPVGASGPVEVERRIFPKKKRRRKTENKWDIKRAERAAQILELRKQGKSMKEISQATDLSGPTVRKIIKETVDKVYSGQAIAYMDLTMKRVEALLGACFGPALDGDLEAIEQARKVIADMRALTGIDAPKRQELTGKDGGAIEIAAAGERVEGRLAAMAARLALGEGIQVTQVVQMEPKDTEIDQENDPDE